MKTKYRFLGTASEIIGVASLKEFGQEVELDPAVAEPLIASDRGPMLIPSDRFEGIGFDPEDLKRYRYPGPRSEAPEQFQGKYRESLIALHEYRRELRGDK